ncbi:CHAT domain-containing protein [Streptomyces sp. NPDC088846]|uniref:CHAT domain-containing protein n=1 Tax=Streptomyces sp. NPDC088846 TaxID=3365908 RepID=UPI00380170BE
MTVSADTGGSWGRARSYWPRCGRARTGRRRRETRPRSSPRRLPSIDTPTTVTVLARLPLCAVVHFACHGVNHRTDQRQLRVHDHATAPLTVSALDRVDLDRAPLAYLAACSTANAGSTGPPEEAIHLISALRLAGFPHVIRTLWSINDRLSVEIAESFSTHLTAGSPGTPAPTGPPPPCTTRSGRYATAARQPPCCGRPACTPVRERGGRNEVPAAPTRPPAHRSGVRAGAAARHTQKVTSEQA